MRHPQIGYNRQQNNKRDVESSNGKARQSQSPKTPKDKNAPA
jgi:hypothetical protein